MKYVLRVIPILAVLVLAFVYLVDRQPASAQGLETQLINVKKANPLPGHESEQLVDTDWANFGTLLEVTVTTSGTTTPTLVITIESDEADQTLLLEIDADATTLTASATGTTKYIGSFRVVDESVFTLTPSSAAVPADESVQRGVLCLPAGSNLTGPCLGVEDEDEVTIISGSVIAVIDVESEVPDFGELTPEHEDVFDSRNVEFNIDVTDDDSGIPEPDDGFGDADDEYFAVQFLISDGQCTDAEVDAQTVNDDSGLPDATTGGPTGNQTGLAGLTCAAATEPITIRDFTDEDDFDDITEGFEIDHIIRLSPGVHFISVLAFDQAGNFDIFDADETDNAVAFAEVTVDVDDPEFFSGAIRTGVGWDSTDDDYDDNEREIIQVVFKDATDLDPDSISASDFVVEGHTVIRAQWFDVDPEEIAGGPDSSAPNAAGPKNADGSRPFVCSLAGVVVTCDTADAKILRPASWIGAAADATRPAINGFAMIRNSVFLTLDDDLDPDEEPEVFIVPDGVDDEAGNSADDINDDAIDAIPPGFSVVSCDSPSTDDCEKLLAGEDDEIELVITSDEELGAKPAVDVRLVTALKGCVVDGVIQTGAAGERGVGDGTGGVDCTSATGGTLSASVKETGTNRWRVTIDDPTDTGYYNIFITGTDKNGNNGDEGIDPADVKDDFFKDNDDCCDDDAIRFQGDVFLPNPLVEVSGQDPNDDDEVEFRNPLFVRIDFDKINTAEGEDRTEDDEYHEDKFDDLTITKFELDGEDLLDLISTTNQKVFLAAIGNISIGEHEIEIQATDDAGNELDDVLEVEFEIEERDDFELEVNPGWNLVSIPGEPADSDIETVFGPGAPVTTIYTFDPSVPGGWLVAVRESTGDPWTGSLTSIEPVRGYWIFSDQIDEVDIPIPRIIGGAATGATPVQPPLIDLVPGWNLVPLIDVTGDAEFGDTIDADVYFAGANEEISRILSFDTITSSWDVVPFTEDPINSDAAGTTLDDPDLEFGKAYWVFVTAAVTLVP